MPTSGNADKAAPGRPLWLIKWLLLLALLVLLVLLVFFPGAGFARSVERLPVAFIDLDQRACGIPRYAPFTVQPRTAVDPTGG